MSKRSSPTRQPEALSDAALEQLKRERFQERVQRVLAVMKAEQVDFRGLPIILPDGRIGVQVVPVEMQQS